MKLIVAEFSALWKFPDIINLEITNGRERYSFVLERDKVILIANQF